MRQRVLLLLLLLLVVGEFLLSSGCSTSTELADTTVETTPRIVPAATMTTSTVPVATTTTEANRQQLAIAVVASYTSTFDLEEIPFDEDECGAWFEQWSHDYLQAEVAAAETENPALIAAVAGHSAAAASALADCLENRTVDTDDLEAQQIALEEALP